MPFPRRTGPSKELTDQRLSTVMIFLQWEARGRRHRFPLFAQVSARVSQEEARADTPASQATPGTSGRTRFHRFTVNVSTTNRPGTYHILITHDADLQPRVVAFTQARGLISLMFRTPGREGQVPMDTDGAARTRERSDQSTTRAASGTTTSQRTMRLLQPTRGATYASQAAPRPRSSRNDGMPGGNRHSTAVTHPMPVARFQPTHMPMQIQGVVHQPDSAGRPFVQHQPQWIMWPNHQ